MPKSPAECKAAQEVKICLAGCEGVVMCLPILHLLRWRENAVYSDVQ